MQVNSEQAILESASRVFETSAFLSVAPLHGNEELADPDQSATMTFRGAAAGRVSLRVSSEMLDMIANNLLEPSEDPNEQAQRRGDVLKEMLNMLCGNLLTEFFGAEPVFDLSPPELLGNDELPPPSSQDMHRLLMNVEDTLAEVLFEVQERTNC
ncbi:MAG: chemotaxis protein CheX [bacterium]|nr:chemotaxis protein CheX [bacterium]